MGYHHALGIVLSHHPRPPTLHCRNGHINGPNTMASANVNLSPFGPTVVIRKNRATALPFEIEPDSVDSSLLGSRSIAEPVFHRHLVLEGELVQLIWKKSSLMVDLPAGGLEQRHTILSRSNDSFVFALQRMRPRVIWTGLVRPGTVVRLLVDWEDTIMKSSRLHLRHWFASVRRVRTETSWTREINRGVRIVIFCEYVHVLVAKCVFENNATNFSWKRKQRGPQAVSLDALIVLAKEHVLVKLVTYIALRGSSFESSALS